MAREMARGARVRAGGGFLGLAPGFTTTTETARAAFAEPSQDVYVAAKQFQTNNLLGCPGRRPDTAPYLIYFAPSPVA